VPIPTGLGDSRRVVPSPRDGTRVVMAASELAPYVKVGGLGEAVAALSRALTGLDCDVTAILPGYRAVFEGPWDLERQSLPSFTVPVGEQHRRVSLWRLHASDLPFRVLVLEDAPGFDRTGVYTDPATGEGFPDDAERFAVFSRAVIETLQRIDLVPDVLHIHDYPTALVPRWMREAGARTAFFENTATVLTLHNVAFQGLASDALLDRLGLGREDFHPGGPLEFWGRVNLLKAGALDADALVAVSGRYAAEIRSGPEFGFGLEGVFASRADALTGIRNGIDTAVWNPAADPHLAQTYTAATLGEKRRNKEALCRRTGLADSSAPLLGMITRLADQKGIDILRAAASRLLERRVSLVVLGSGKPEYESFLAALAHDHPGRVHHDRSFNESLAHAIQGGADFLLVPSRYEPCGLTQMVALRYGTLPIVRRTGGLAETVVDVDAEPDRGTGIVFDAYTAGALLDAVDRALAVAADPVRDAEARRRAMAADVSWAPAARAYADLYRRLLRQRPAAS